MRLYEAIILSALLYRTDVWPLTATLTKRLNAAHHRWQRSIVGISLKGRVTSKKGQSQNWTTQYRWHTQWKKTALAWTCDVNGPPAQRIRHQVLHWEVLGFKRGTGHLHTKWRSTVNKDLLRMGITWEEAEVSAQSRSEWRWSVAQCIHLNAGWIKVKVKTNLKVNSLTH